MVPCRLPLKALEEHVIISTIDGIPGLSPLRLLDLTTSLLYQSPSNIPLFPEHMSRGEPSQPLGGASQTSPCNKAIGFIN
ncbi:unnamed protein product [Protopolystoma xenopodis]|uniref:Uncharacterized protein n=1 Tax=Protopolystoma xenopodis TaxID=117903 RepID=A0A3S5CHN3_9PLAT|nr:unnamed protein product [Protopolystoma xenopodis]